MNFLPHSRKPSCRFRELKSRTISPARRSSSEENEERGLRIEDQARAGEFYQIGLPLLDRDHNAVRMIHDNRFSSNCEGHFLTIIIATRYSK